MKRTWHFTIVTFIIGFMLAVQFQTTKQPAVRDTRDIWELRQQLRNEQELHRQLLEDIQAYDELLASYEQERLEGKEALLRKTVDELKKEAGLTEVVGEGVVLTIDLFYDPSYEGAIVHTIPVDLLERLVNELNMYGAEEVAIADKRLVDTTAIRDVNGVTKVDGHALRSFPFEVKVIASDAEKLYNRLKASTIADEFVADDLQLIISEPLPRVVIPPYDRSIAVKHMEAIE